MAVVSLSLDQTIIDQARARAETLGFKSFSAYVQHVLREDLLASGPMEIREAFNSTARALADEAAANALQAAATPAPSATRVRYTKTPKRRRAGV